MSKIDIWLYDLVDGGDFMFVIMILWTSGNYFGLRFFKSIEMLWRSMCEVEMWYLKWLLLWVVDFQLLLVAWVMLGYTSKYGLKCPAMGPLELKNKCGKCLCWRLELSPKFGKGRSRYTECQFLSLIIWFLWRWLFSFQNMSKTSSHTYHHTKQYRASYGGTR